MEDGVRNEKAEGRTPQRINSLVPSPNRIVTAFPSNLHLPLLEHLAHPTVHAERVPSTQHLTRPDHRLGLLPARACTT
jgi:hypothetical protein